MTIKQWMISPILSAIILSTNSSFAQNQNNSFLISSDRINSVPDISITVSILCVGGFRFAHEITYKRGVLSTSMTQILSHNKEPIACFENEKNIGNRIIVP